MQSQISPNILLNSFNSITSHARARETSILSTGSSREVRVSPQTEGDELCSYPQENSLDYPVMVRIAETLTKVGLRDRAERMAQTVTDEKAKAWVLMSIAKTLAEQG